MDNAVHKAILAEQLQSWGMHDDCAPDSSKALERIRSACGTAQPYDLGILDHRIPGMDGMTLGRMIKKDPNLARMHLVLLTSFGQRALGPTARRAGFSGCLAKPVRQSQLYDCIGGIMGMQEVLKPLELSIGIHPEPDGDFSPQRSLLGQILFGVILYGLISCISEIS